MRDRFFSILQYIFSVAGNLFCIYLCVVGILYNYAIIKGPPYAVAVALIICLVFLAYLEGLHFGIVSVQHTHLVIEQRFHRAQKIQNLITREPKVVQRFLIGRQSLVIVTVFLIAQMTTFPGKIDPYLHKILSLIKLCFDCVRLATYFISVRAHALLQIRNCWNAHYSDFWPALTPATV